MEEARNLPIRLSICEQGDWSLDNVFVPTGLYEAQDDNGTPYHIASQERDIERWLLDNGYRDTGDGIHYHQIP